MAAAVEAYLANDYLKVAEALVNFVVLMTRREKIVKSLIRNEILLGAQSM